MMSPLCNKKLTFPYRAVLKSKTKLFSFLPILLGPGLRKKLRKLYFSLFCFFHGGLKLRVNALARARFIMLAGVSKKALEGSGPASYAKLSESYIGQRKRETRGVP
jgi:hypothetical protein